MADVIKIRVPKDEIVLEVNDNGDTIVLPVSDERFSQRMIHFANKVSEDSKKLSEVDQADIMSVVNADVDFHDMLKTEFNELFGPNAYEKVFGADVLVGAEYVMEFIDQCLPYVQAHATKRAEKFNKYSADRVGSSL